MSPFYVLRSRGERSLQIPIFPLKTVLFPGGLLPLKVFEQRYVDMTKTCLQNNQPFGVCLLLEGDEVARESARAPKFAPIGTLATITDWDMPQLGILHLKTEGGARFQVKSHEVGRDGLASGSVSLIESEPLTALTDAQRPLAHFLELLIHRAGPQNFPAAQAFDDATWVGYRLAEVLPLPLSIKQGMLEINDSEIRLKLIGEFLGKQGLL